MSVQQLAAYPATFEQDAMWGASELSGGPDRFLESWALRLRGPLDQAVLCRAVADLFDRHEALRTRLAVDGLDLLQVVSPPGGTRVRRRSCTAGRLDGELRALVTEPFGANEDLARATLVALSPLDHVLVVQVHHAIVDDWALAILDEDLAELYAARIKGRAPELAPAGLPGEYAARQRAAGADGAAVAYWRERLRGVPGGCAPVPDRPRPPEPTWRGERVTFPIGTDIARGVRRACREARTTPFTIFAAALALLLRWQTHADEVIIGTPVSRRGADGTERLVGCLTDLLPLRLRGTAAESFGAAIATAHEVTWAAIAHRDVPYAAILAQAEPAERVLLCPVVLVLDDVRQAALDFPGLTAERVHIPSGMAKFDLCLMIDEKRGEYHAAIDYMTDLYDRPSIERLARQFTGLLGTAVADPSATQSLLLDTVEEEQCQ